jgi:hypothetical protein
MFPREMVCLRNILVDTLHKGDIDNDNNDDNNSTNKVVLQKLTGPQQVKKLLCFMETEGSLPHSQ